MMQQPFRQPEPALRSIQFPNNYMALAAAHQGHENEERAALDRYYETSPNRSIEKMLWATQRCDVDRPAFARYDPTFVNENYRGFGYRWADPSVATSSPLSGKQP
jgi:hypothetical protein